MATTNVCVCVATLLLVLHIFDDETSAVVRSLKGFGVPFSRERRNRNGITGQQKGEKEAHAHAKEHGGRVTPRLQRPWALFGQTTSLHNHEDNKTRLSLVKLRLLLLEAENRGIPAVLERAFRKAFRKVR